MNSRPISQWHIKSSNNTHFEQKKEMIIYYGLLDANFLFSISIFQAGIFGSSAIFTTGSTFAVTTGAGVTTVDEFTTTGVVFGASGTVSFLSSGTTGAFTTLGAAVVGASFFNSGLTHDFAGVGVVCEIYC